MKRYLCLLLVLVLLLLPMGCKKDAAQTAANDTQPMIFNAEDYTSTGTCGDNVQWGINAATGELGIGGEGAMYDYSLDLEPAPWADYNYTSVRVCDGVTAIGIEAFRGCESLVSAEISGTVTSIGAKAFYACTALTEVSISSGVTEIGPNAFSNCTALAKISVHADNANYKSVDGVLFSKDGKTLLQYPVGSGANSYKIPDGTQTISELAFGFCGDTLSALEIPASVTSIEKAAFVGCRVLSSVTYKGSEAQWKSVKLAPENDLLTFAEFRFS